MLEKTWFWDFANSICNNHSFGWIFNLVLTVLISTTIVRLIFPVRLSIKANQLLLLAFFAFSVEQFYWKEYEFCPSAVFGLPYGWFLLLIPLTEILLRITYVFRIDYEKENLSLFLENQPIIISDEEKARKNVVNLLAGEIKKSKFNSSYSIGLVGDWGIGKTSFINTLEKALGDSSIIIHFRPWLSLGKNSLLKGFSDSLTAKLGKYDNNLISDVDHYIKSLIKVEQSANSNVVELISDLFHPHEDSKETEFKAIDKAIKAIDKRIIIFVDDLDRLDSDEIIEVLKLIRNTANFSNVIYISCYDKVYLLHALQNFNKRNLTIVLDKFFDVEIPISPIPLDELVNKIDNLFLNKESFGIANEDAQEIRNYVLKNRLFTQYREVNKFLTSILLNYKMYGSRLSVQEFFYFEILKVRYPFLPSLLWHQKEYFFARQYSPEIITLTANKENIILIEAYLSSGEENEFQRQFLGIRDLQFISDLLQKLFSRKSSHPMAIHQPNAFNSYFYYEIPDIANEEFTLDDITNNQFKEHIYFTKPFDAKRETDLLSYFENEDSIRDKFSSNSDTLFKFLIFLVEWSGGKITVEIFIKAYTIIESIKDKNSHFKNLFETDLGPTKKIFARTNFLSALVRNFQYKRGPEITFVDAATLKDINYKLFEAYIGQVQEFSNETSEALYHQIVGIDPKSTAISINPDALKLFKSFISRWPKRYLDLSLRSGMIPNYDLTFVFAPFTLQLFGTKDEFSKFIQQADYPERRKEKLLDYLKLSNLNKNNVLEFQLPEPDLSFFPSEFTNAWRDVHKQSKDKIKLVKSETSHVFKNTAKAEEPLVRNDDIYKEIFNLETTDIRIDIDPMNTEFWQLGFTFMRSEIFPNLDEGREYDRTSASIYLSAGERTADNKWILPNQLKLLHDKRLQIVTPDFIKHDKLKRGEKVTIAFKPQDMDRKVWVFEILVNTSSVVGSRTYDLSGYNYFVVGAWCEGMDFEISTKITLLQPIPN
ncbi:MAG: P-loop NTPase fold protein [Bacteroidota bacterium]